MVPTRYYGWFANAERLGKSVRELLTGAPGPLTGMEERLWQRKNAADARLRQQAQPPGRRR